jgi:hypothetical protein
MQQGAAVILWIARWPGRDRGWLRIKMDSVHLFVKHLQ